MNSTNTFAVNFSRLKLILALCILIPSVPLLLILGYYSLDSLIAIFTISTILILEFYSIAKLLFFLRCSYRNLAALSVNPTQLVDNINGIIFDWADIEWFSKESIKFSPLIRIHLKNSDDYILKIKNPVLRKLATLRLFDPFLIQTNILEIHRGKLFDSLNEFHKSFRETIITHT